MSARVELGCVTTGGGGTAAVTVAGDALVEDDSVVVGVHLKVIRAWKTSPAKVEGLRGVAETCSFGGAKGAPAEGEGATTWGTKEGKELRKDIDILC